MVEQIVGVLVLLLALVDVFVTVLYARVGSGLVAMNVARVFWAGFREASKLCGRRRAKVVAFAAPLMLVAFIAMWAGLLALGSALIVHPELGRGGVTNDHGATSTDFATALYVAGNAISVIGTSGHSPQTGALKVFFLLASSAGMAILSLTITYVIQIYAALQHRNALGLKVDMLTGGTGDAADFVARLAPFGRFDASMSILSDLASEIAVVKEAHHFYPLLIFFRFEEATYAVSRFSLVVLDAVSLVKSAVDAREVGWVCDCAPVTQLGLGATRMLEMLVRTFVPEKDRRREFEPSDDDRVRWRRRWTAARRQMMKAGIPVVDDEKEAFERYVALRAQWDHYVEVLSPWMSYSLDEIDVAGGMTPEPMIERRLGTA